MVGFDNTDLAADPAYDLASVWLPEEPWAEAIVASLLGRLRAADGEAPSERTRVVLEPRFIPRGSIGPAPRTAG